MVSHEGPTQWYQYNLLTEWENREITKEPLRIIAADDPVACAIYVRENGLLVQPGWKCFNHIAKNEKKFTHTVNQAKLKSLTQHLNINMVMKFLGLMNKLNALTREMGTPYGETLLF
jgi:hypothetical protein